MILSRRGSGGLAVRHGCQPGPQLAFQVGRVLVSRHVVYPKIEVQGCALFSEKNRPLAACVRKTDFIVDAWTFTTQVGNQKLGRSYLIKDPLRDQIGMLDFVRARSAVIPNLNTSLIQFFTSSSLGICSSICIMMKAVFGLLLRTPGAWDETIARARFSGVGARRSILSRICLPSSRKRFRHSGSRDGVSSCSAGTIPKTLSSSETTYELRYVNSLSRNDAARDRSNRFVSASSVCSNKADFLTASIRRGPKSASLRRIWLASSRSSSVS